MAKNMIRWDPFREMMTMREMMDRYFNEPIVQAPRLWQRGMDQMSLALDVAEDADQYIVKASLPGVNPDDVEVTLTENTLTIKGHIEDTKETRETAYHLRERYVGSFVRSVTLPTPVEVDKIEATNENGVLTLHLPKAEATKPKRIEVKKVIEAKS